jgi:hypothetical protein
VTVPLTIGVFPLGLAGSPSGVASGPPDDYQAIGLALDDLAGDGPALVVRMYASWVGTRSEQQVIAQVAQMTQIPAPVDLVLSYRDPTGDVEGYAAFAARVMSAHGAGLASLQITSEANLVGIPNAADGSTPRAAEALVAGVIAAAQAKPDPSASAAVGFAVSPEVDPQAGSFWPTLGRLGSDALAAAVDYAGLDMYPDVFGPPIGLDRLDAAIDWLLRSLRESALPIAGIGPETPIRVCETGWPTSSERSEERQTEMLEANLRAVHARRDELNVTHWQLFTLRDADGANADLFHQFGILHSDYSPKPAFARLRTLIAELRAAAP